MKIISDIWDERYSISEYIYGEDPNVYLKKQLKNLPIGQILFVGEGEGRNAVYAAKLGWNVSAYDLSSEGKKKAQQLADKNNVHINYDIGHLYELNYQKKQFDVIALIFAHFSLESRSSIHQTLSNYLRSGGTIIMEAFSKDQTRYQTSNPNAGGPKNVDMLYTVEEIKRDFDNFKVLELKEVEIYLSEGSHHDGLSSVIRFTGQKND